MAHAVGMRLLVVPEANEDTEYAECHPATMLRRQGIPPPGRRDEDLTPGDGQKHQRSGVGPFAMKPSRCISSVLLTPPTPMSAAAMQMTDVAKGCRARRNISKVWPNLHVSAHRHNA
jgi:hypothetical protein